METNNYEVVSRALKNFYERRIDKLEKIDIFDVLKRKNPYLYRAFGTNDAHDFIEEVLVHYQSSSDETIFGDFFEEVAIGVSKNGRKSSANSIDVEVWSDDQKSVSLYAVKSGTHVFNAQSKERQRQAFMEAQRRLQGIAVTPIVGYSYGRRRNSSSNRNNFNEHAGQVFWRRLSGQENFYIELIELIGKAAEEHKQNFKREWDKCINRQFLTFMKVFGSPDGSILWDLIVKYSSAEKIPKEIQKSITKAKQNIN